MSKILAILLCLIITFWSLSQANQASAATPDCKDVPLTLTFGYNLNNIYYDAKTNSTFPKNIEALFFTFKGPLTEGATYRFRADYDFSFGYDLSNEAQAHNGTLELFSNNPALLRAGPHKGVLQQQDSDGWHDPPYCQNINYFIGNNYTLKTCKITFKPEQIPLNQAIFATISHAISGKHFLVYVGNFVDKNSSKKEVEVDDNGNGNFSFTVTVPQTDATIEINQQIGGTIRPICKQTFNVNAATRPNTQPTCSVFPKEPDFTTPIAVDFINPELKKTYQARIINANSGLLIKESLPYQSQNTKYIRIEYKPPLLLFEDDYLFEVYSPGSNSLACPSEKFHIKGATAKAATPPEKECSPGDPGCTAAGGLTSEGCTTIKDPNDPKKVIPNPHPGVATAIGCIHTNPAEFVKDVMTFLLGISGSLAFLMMLLGVFQMLTSAGNPETLHAGRERLTSAVIGLLIVIFATLLLQIIGLDILHLPGFGR